MPNVEIERVVDGMIQSGRISRDMRDVYIKDLESGLGDHLLRGSDYTRKTQELAEAKRQAQAALDTERNKILEDKRKLESWYGTVEGELNGATQLREEKAAMAARMAAAEQALKDYGVYDAVNLPPINNQTQIRTPSYQPPQSPVNPAKPTNPNPFLTRDEFDRIGAGLFDLMDKVSRIQAKHQKLFNEPLEDNLITHFHTTGEDPEQYWKTKYAVANREAEIQSKNREAEIAKIREEERAKLQAEYAIDPSRVVAPFQGGPKGGLTPLMERYSSSRALEHSQNHANDDAATGRKDLPIPPEQKPELAAARDRINSASKFYHENWDLNANPISEQGRQLSQRYAQS